MDLVLPDRPHHLTPAKQKVEESAAANKDDFLSKKLKVEEIPVDKKDDIPSDVKSEDDLLSKKHEAVEAAACQKAEEEPAANEDDRSSDVILTDDDVYSLNSFLPKIEPKPLKNEGIVVEITDAISLSSEVENDDDDDDDDDENDDDPDFDREKYKRYIEEYKRSKGFDIDNYYFGGKCTFGLLRPLCLEEEDCYVVRDCKKAVEAAIKYQNAKNDWNLELEKITKCNYVFGTRYYATFDAKDRDTGVSRTFQTKVTYFHLNGKTMIFRFREKPDSPPEHLKSDA